MRLAGTGFVYLFVTMLVFNIYVPVKLLFNLSSGHSGSKPQTTVFFATFYVVAYYLLFHVLKLENVNYNDPQYRPTARVVRMTWIIWLSNFGLLMLQIFVKIMIEASR